PRRMSLHSGWRKDGHRIEKEIVPLYRHALRLAQIQNLFEGEVKCAHEIVAVDAEYARLHGMEPNQAGGGDGVDRRDLERYVQDLVHHSRLDQLRAGCMDLEMFQRGA